jgi:Zn-dependent peptidase ImmA (M78 family)
MIRALTARDVLAQHWDKKLPVNVEAIAKGLGMDVLRQPNPGYSGLFTKLADGTPVCSINSADAPVRQRFTVAHEIGHLVLGHESGYRDGPEAFSTDNRDPREVAANQFAAELLMPEAAIRFLVFEKKISDVAVLAVKADVSQVAMQYRLKNLGLVS